MVVLGRTFSTMHVVFGLKCSNPQCSNILGYEGTEHRITPLGICSGVYYAMTTSYFIEIVGNIFRSAATLDETYRQMLLNYNNRMVTHYFPTKPVFLAAFQICSRTLVTRHIPESALTCVQCGTGTPPVIVVDGKTMGIRQSSIPSKYFNDYKDQKEPPKCGNPSVIRSDYRSRSVLS